MQITRLSTGKEQSPLLLVDNFIPQPEALVEYACGQQFLANSPYYPGVRSAAPESYRQFMLQSLQATLIDYFALPATALGFSVCHFSLVTTPPTQLKLLQRIPHFDTTEKHALAAVHYLFHGDQGGTAFYRHRKTGFETIDDSRTMAYYRALEAENDGPNLPKASDGYIGGDTALFEQIGAQQGIFNRLIIYRRHALHSGIINQNTSLSANPRLGRLTISSFIDMQPAHG
ncbi:MAG: hypothetical protein CVV11_13815 [Gammaproteobacteria bacterium HGW-Gammaproteobacteria-15]|nr:MAG: hypothetical protein CVV11_13815 [Gammaproteobacteria bacterium HGW-Gammaproteobacteria-15]